MDEKLKKIFNKIGIDEKILVHFYNAKLKDVAVDELKNVVDIAIENDSDIPLDDYKEITDRFKKYFDDAKINLKIINNTGKSNYFREYLEMLQNDYKEEFPDLNFIADKISFTGNYLTIKAVNEKEKKDIEETMEKITRFLIDYGVVFSYTIEIDDNIRIEIDDSI